MKFDSNRLEGLDATIRELFYGSKAEWYELREDGSKDWTGSESKIDQFWSEVFNYKVDQGDNDFSEFVFPRCVDWAFHENSEYSHYDFFLKDSDFRSVTILDELSFRHIDFKGDMVISGNDLQLLFYNCKGKGFKISGFLNTRRIEFLECKLNSLDIDGKLDSLIIQLSDFNENVEINICAELLNINQCSIEGGFDIKRRGEGIKELDLNIVSIETSLRFRCKGIVKGIWRDLRFGPDCSVTFEKLKIAERLRFDGIKFDENVDFHRWDFSKIQFSNCDFQHANFYNCEFGRVGKRIKFIESKSRKLTDSYLKDTISQYRQLKNNRANEKDWIDAGDAYRSEMYWRRKQVGLDIKNGNLSLIVNWLVMSLSSLFSAYQQSIGRPLGWLTFTIISPIVVLYYLCPEGGVFIAFKMSIDAATPLIGKIYYGDYPDWVFIMLAVERVFSVLFIALFFISARGRMRL